MKGINYNRVKYLYQAVQMGTVRAAADKLNVAPSAVSRQIAQLEEELAVTLIERHRRGVKVTQAGEVVLQHYRESLSQQEDCISKLNALRGLHRGHINLAVGEGFVGDVMSEPLPEFHHLYPNLTLSITMGGTNEVLSKVEQDQAHIGILFHPPSHPSIRVQVKQQHPLRLIVSSEHPLLALGRAVSLKEASAFPCALQEAHFGVRQLLAVAEFQEQLRLDPLVTTNSIAVMKNFVRSGLGVTYLPTFVVAREIEDGHLQAVSIEQSILSCGETQLITRLGRQLPEGPLALLQHLTQWMHAFQ